MKTDRCSADNTTAKTPHQITGKTPIDIHTKNKKIKWGAFITIRQNKVVRLSLEHTEIHLSQAN